VRTLKQTLQKAIQKTALFKVSAMVLGLVTTALSVQTHAQAINNSPSSPAARDLSVRPSSDSAPVAGTSSASPLSATFVPQIALHSGEAELFEPIWGYGFMCRFGITIETACPQN